MLHFELHVRTHRLRPIANEVPPAHDLAGVLHAADERDCIQRAVERAAEEPLPAYGGADGKKRHGGADPRNGSAGAPDQAALTVFEGLLLNCHATAIARRLLGPGPAARQRMTYFPWAAARSAGGIAMSSGCADSWALTIVSARVTASGSPTRKMAFASTRLFWVDGVESTLS